MPSLLRPTGKQAGRQPRFSRPLVFARSRAAARTQCVPQCARRRVRPPWISSQASYKRSTKTRLHVKLELRAREEERAPLSYDPAGLDAFGRPGKEVVLQLQSAYFASAVSAAHASPASPDKATVAGNSPAPDVCFDIDRCVYPANLPLSMSAVRPSRARRGHGSAVE